MYILSKLANKSKHNEKSNYCSDDDHADRKFCKCSTVWFWSFRFRSNRGIRTFQFKFRWWICWKFRNLPIIQRRNHFLQAPISAWWWWPYSIGWQQWWRWCTYWRCCLATVRACSVLSLVFPAQSWKNAISLRCWNQGFSLRSTSSIINGESLTFLPMVLSIFFIIQKFYHFKDYKFCILNYLNMEHEVYRPLHNILNNFFS